MKVVNGGNSPTLSELGGETRTEAVLYVGQELTASQQAQARANIGVVWSGEVAYLGDVVGQV